MGDLGTGASGVMELSSPPGALACPWGTDAHASFLAKSLQTPVSSVLWPANSSPTGVRTADTVSEKNICWQNLSANAPEYVPSSQAVGEFSLGTSSLRKVSTSAKCGISIFDEQLDGQEPAATGRRVLGELTNTWNGQPTVSQSLVLSTTPSKVSQSSLLATTPSHAAGWQCFPAPQKPAAVHTVTAMSEPISIRPSSGLFNTIGRQSVSDHSDDDCRDEVCHSQTSTVISDLNAGLSESTIDHCENGERTDLPVTRNVPLRVASTKPRPAPLELECSSPMGAPSPLQGSFAASVASKSKVSIEIQTDPIVKCLSKAKLNMEVQTDPD